MTDIMIRTCECHGVEMYWHKDKSRPGGGRWRCKIKRSSQDKKWRKSPSGKKSIRKYLQTDKSKARQKRYSSSEKGQINKLKTSRTYEEKNYWRRYFTKRDRQIALLRAKTIEELEDIRKQLKELGLEPRQK